jgi:Icc protein
VLIAHLSDPHLVTGPLAAEPAAALQRALARALTFSPDFVVITGDLADHADPAEYAVLRDLIAAYPLPIHLVAGNHDSAEALVDAFAGTPYLGGGASAHYAVEYPEATLVVLDSAVPCSPAGTLGPAQLGWLADTLSARPSVPALVALHHPPIASGLPYMDQINLRDADALAAVVSRHAQVARVLTGHLHRPLTAAFAGTVLTVAPSTYRQLNLDLHTDGIAFAAEPPAFLLHLLGAGQCVTHTVPVTHTSAPFAVY